MSNFEIPMQVAEQLTQIDPGTSMGGARPKATNDAISR